MKFAFTLAALAFAVAGVQAQPVDMATRLASSGVMSPSPSSVSFSVRGGLSAFRTITITDTGAGYDSNMNVTLTQTRDGGHGAYLFISSETCTGATLAPNGTCTIHLEFDGACPYADSSAWRIDVTSTNAPSISIPVTGNSLSGICM